MRLVLRVLAFALTLLVWHWVRVHPWSREASLVLILVGPFILVPIATLGRFLLQCRATVERAEWVSILVHYAAMISLGAAIIEALKIGEAWPGWRIPIPAGVGWALMGVTGAATVLTVLNLAVRGLGAPFAIALSRRLATDWMYAWTRNPMVLGMLAFLTAWGLWIGSAVAILWVILLVSPALLILVKVYEERELEIRFGQCYLDYKARTPMLWPRIPKTR